MAVVDPTVGGDRRAVALRLADGRILVGPDNGLLWPAALAAGGVEQAFEISASPWRLDPVSATFHGRDIFAAVAAHLAAGKLLELAGDVLDPTELVQLETPRASAEGGVVLVPVIGADGFGNVQLGAVHDDLTTIGLGWATGSSSSSSQAKGASAPTRSRSAMSRTASCSCSRTPRSSSLSAVNRGSAVARLGLRPGDQLRITGAPEQ